MAEQQEQEQGEGVLNPSVAVEDAGPALKKLSIEVPDDRIHQRLEEGFERLQTDAQVPGFRPGRAPRRLLERRFGSDLREEVKGRILSDAYAEALKQTGLEAIGSPDVKEEENLELPEDGPLSFEVEVEVHPHIELPPLEDIEIDRPSAEVTDEEIEKELDQHREAMGSLTDRPADAALERGDVAICDVAVYPGHEPAEDAEAVIERSQEPVMVPREEDQGLVAGLLVDDLASKLEGATPGRTVRIATTGPESYEDENVRGQPVTAVVTIQNVQRLEPAPIETIVERAGTESEDDLRDRLRHMLEQRKQGEQRESQEKQARDYLVERAEVELPEKLTEQQVEQMVERERQRLRGQGLPDETIDAELESIRQRCEEEARRDVKLYFVLERVAQELELEVTSQELNGQIAQMAMQRGRRPEKMRQELQQSGEMASMRQQALQQKAVDALLEKAHVRDADGASGSDDAPADNE